MSKKASRADVVLLCEDPQTSVFVRQYLNMRRPNWRIRTDPAFTYRQRKEGGIGNSYVLKRVGENVNRHRHIAKRAANTCLVIVIDADENTIEEKINQLDLQLRNQNIASIGKNERILVLVPKRNIETWIEYGQGQIVDESTSYKKLKQARDCKPIVKKYVTEICPNRLPEDAPQSLHHACDELAKVL